MCHVCARSRRCARFHTRDDLRTAIQVRQRDPRGFRNHRQDGAATLVRPISQNSVWGTGQYAAKTRRCPRIGALAGAPVVMRQRLLGLPRRAWLDLQAPCYLSLHPLCPAPQRRARAADHSTRTGTPHRQKPAGVSPIAAAHRHARLLGNLSGLLSRYARRDERNNRLHRHVSHLGSRRQRLVKQVDVLYARHRPRNAARGLQEKICQLHALPASACETSLETGLLGLQTPRLRCHVHPRVQIVSHGHRARLLPPLSQCQSFQTVCHQAHRVCRTGNRRLLS